MKRSCSRSWLAEAIRDGRVKGAERDTFGRHTKICQECADEVHSLKGLGTALRRLATTGPDLLSIRRQRQRLLADVDAASLARSSGRSSPSAAAWACVAAAALLLAFFAPRLHHRWFPVAPVAVASIVDVRPEPGSRWFRTQGQDFDRVDLVEGSLWLRIHRSRAEVRVTIAVPDGEIDDFGTVLSVNVVHGRTERVIVDEGGVAVRLKGRPEFHLGPGESWTAPQEIAPVASIAPPSGVIDVPHPGPSIGSHVTSKPTRKERAVSTEVERPTATTRQSLAEIEAGNAEDKQYIEIIDLVRAGKTSAARATARDYLERFPNGFRRIEVMDVATGRSSHL